MNAELIMLGGAEEIGANCCYLDLDGTGILIDAGLHPRDRSSRAFPDIDVLGDRPTDVLVVTHAHTDHIGAVPYVMRRLPHLRPIMTHATRDLSHIVLHNGARLLRGDISASFPKQWLEFYGREEIEALRYAFEAVPYDDPLRLRGYSGRSAIDLGLHWSGHILGSSSVSLNVKGFSVLHTADIMLSDQFVVPKARIPRHHVDVLITEATNAATKQLPTYAEETKRLAAFVNGIVARNGSVLIPCFALGKLQEMVVHLYSMMRRGSIPHLPIYTGGIGVRINKVYDQYCYSDPMKRPGFEVSDIPQERLRRDELLHGDFMRNPSIVLAPSGMMNFGTMSNTLARQWFTRPEFGIAFIGYQDPESPGHSLLASEKKKPFDFGSTRSSRVCEVERFRFSSHASGEHLVELAEDIRPSTVVITHGDAGACESLALEIHERLPGTRIIIPQHGKPYTLLQSE
ncbi:MAG: MBL fold metallo-hydrolase [Candidatus Kapabacteria bacterium]|nr:MBL fold metallo-hydrolase [Candidatus Kapabacteria bacterium]